MFYRVMPNGFWYWLFVELPEAVCWWIMALIAHFVRGSIRDYLEHEIYEL